MMLSLRRIKIATLLAFVFLFGIGTSPLPPPYHQYNVSGTLERPQGGSKSNFTVILLGKARLLSDTTFQILRGRSFSEIGDWPIALTDSSGEFSIRVSNHVPLDSLRLAVIIPDSPMVLGVPFSVDTSLAIREIRTYEIENGAGCGGCGTEPTTERRIVYYSYYITGKDIIIPY